MTSPDGTCSWHHGRIAGVGRLRDEDGSWRRTWPCWLERVKPRNLVEHGMDGGFASSGQLEGACVARRAADCASARLMSSSSAWRLSSLLTACESSSSSERKRSLTAAMRAAASTRDIVGFGLSASRPVSKCCAAQAASCCSAATAVRWRSCRAPPARSTTSCRAWLRRRRGP